MTMLKGLAARVRGKRLGRPTTPARFVTRIEELAGTMDMSIRQIQDALQGNVSKSAVGEIVKRVREQSQEVPL
jgi:hypothetical protein